MSNSLEGGALPFPMPPSSTGVGKGDKVIAKSTATKLLAAIKATKDPQLKATFSQALADLNQHLAQDTREAKKGQAPKVKAVREANPKSRKA